jgi:membrane-bound serine protease (ClpP class)
MTATRRWRSDCSGSLFVAPRAYNRIMARVRGLLAGALIAAGVLAVSGQADKRPLVLVAELDGIIHPIAVEYLNGIIDRADTSGAEVVVFVLRTPGGLLDSTREIVSRMITSRAPVVVYVGPSGARAASAGFIITLAADVAVMAPGTHIGAAHPVSGTGQQMDETMSAKVASDTAAYARSLAQARMRNAELAAQAVTESRAFTDREALDAMPPLIDVIANDVDDLLSKLDGRRIQRFDGRTTTVRTSHADVQRIEMTRRQRFLSTIAHPQVAYLLLTLGILGLTVELWNPGAIVPGVAGGLAVLLAFFAFQIVPVNTAGLLLILFGLALLVLELKVPSFGVLGIGGVVSLLIGSIMMTREVPGIRVGLGVIVPVALGLAAIVLGLGRLAFKAQRQPPRSGIEAMLGEVGRTRTPVTADTAGHIDVHGEIWRAFSRTPVPPGAPVRVVEVNGLTLVVEPVNGTEQS